MSARFARDERDHREARGRVAHLVSLRESAGRPPTVPLIMPHADPEFYAAERLATGVRGSLLAYTSGRVPSCRRPRSTGGAGSC